MANKGTFKITINHRCSGFTLCGDIQVSESSYADGSLYYISEDLEGVDLERLKSTIYKWAESGYLKKSEPWLYQSDDNPDGLREIPYGD